MPLTFAARKLRTLVILAVALTGTAQAADERIGEQRELFVHAYQRAELGDWSGFEALSPDEQRLLQDYTLWPDLRAAYLRARIHTVDHGEIDAFLSRYGTLRPARSLRYRHALALAREGNLAAFHRIYEEFYAGLGIARLDCLALRAELDTRGVDEIVDRALGLWLVARSQADECDPLFDRLRQLGIIGADEYRRRFELAVADHEFTRARWLARSIDEEHLAVARLWLRAHDSPESFVRGHASLPDNDTSRQQLVHAIERLTYADPDLAAEHWSRIDSAYEIAESERHATARHIALWTARDGLPAAYARLSALPETASDDEVLRWRARVSLRGANWDGLRADLDLMSGRERAADEWRYWRAIAVEASGEDPAASASLEELAGERSFYGFLAADKTGRDYAFDHDDYTADEAIISRLAVRPELIRARELFRVGLDGRGRAEWDAAVSGLSAGEKTQAAILADRWGWHSRAIALAASVGEYDDLSIRFPLPYPESFQHYAKAASIAPTWAYGVARSESLFMRDVRSSAGAIGLMQLMPATGKAVARQMHLPYRGLVTLTDPDSNIRLGTSYLGSLAERYAGNRVLATAAYNAGPHRVDRWLPAADAVDARVWIENIPFNETRKYVRRVLAAETIFHWRMTGETRRLSETLALIEAAADSTQLAQRQP